MDTTTYQRIKKEGGKNLEALTHIPDCDDDDCDDATHVSQRGWRYDRIYGWVDA